MLRHLTLILCCSTLLLQVAFGNFAQAEALSGNARIVEGQPFDARLIGVDAQRKVIFLLPDGKRRDVPLDKLIRWGKATEANKGPQVVLVDGSLIQADEMLNPIEIVQDHLVAYSDQVLMDKASPGTALMLPLDQLRGILFRVPTLPEQRDRLLERMTSSQGRSDLVVLENGDELEGAVTGMNGDAVLLKTKGGEVRLDVSKVIAMRFNPVLSRSVPQSKHRVIVSLADGSRLMAEDLLADKAVTHIRLQCNLSLQVPTSHITGLQPLDGEVVYLSDLKEQSYKHVKFLSLSWPMNKDRNTAGGRLRSGAQIFQKGLGMHSAARVTYRLDKPFGRLEAELAIDATAGNRGSVTYRVYVDDGKGTGTTNVWKIKYTSQVIRGGMAPVPMSVDMTGVKRISLIIDFADHGDTLDHANWLDARLVP